MDLEARIALVASTWTPTQQLHVGNVAWRGSGCDGAPPSDAELQGSGWFAEVWQDDDVSEVEGHFSPALSTGDRASALDQIRRIAPSGAMSLVTDSAMAETLRLADVREIPDVPHFLLQHRHLHCIEQPELRAGYLIVTAEDAGEPARVEAHRLAWAPARIKRVLGLAVTGDEPPSSFTLDKYRAMKSVSIYQPELDVVVLASDGSPAAYALGWLDPGSGSVLFEPVGTAPEHARRGLAQAACLAVMNAARDLDASVAVVGPRGDDAYPAPRRLYESIGFTTLTRTCTFTWPQ